MEDNDDTLPDLELAYRAQGIAEARLKKARGHEPSSEPWVSSAAGDKEPLQKNFLCTVPAAMPGACSSCSPCRTVASGWLRTAPEWKPIGGRIAWPALVAPTRTRPGVLCGDVAPP